MQKATMTKVEGPPDSLLPKKAFISLLHQMVTFRATDQLFTVSVSHCLMKPKPETLLFGATFVIVDL